MADPQAVYDYACTKYKEAIELIGELSELCKISHADFSMEIAVREFDYVLQCILYREAIKDRKLHPLELQFIEKITACGDVLQLINSKNEINMAWEDINSLNKRNIKKLADIIEFEVNEYADDFVTGFAVVDALTPDKDYLHELDSRIASICMALSAIDGKAAAKVDDNKELDAALEQHYTILSSKWNALKEHVLKQNPKGAITPDEGDDGNGGSLKDEYVKKKK